jgi:polyisoprenoid-binding protein YceI
MKVKSIVRLAMLLLPTMSLVGVDSLLAQAQTFSVRKEDSHIGFAVYKWVVFKEEGRFKDFAGTIVYDPKNPATGSVEFTVRTNSVDSRNEGRDRALRSQEFFHVQQYPTLSFTSTSVSAKGADTLLVTGDLTLRGVTKRLTIPVKVLGVNRVGDLGELAGFESSFVVNREDFGIARGWDIISKEATVHLMVGASSGGRQASR